MLAFLVLRATAVAAAATRMTPCDACRMVVYNLNVSLLDSFTPKGLAVSQCRAPSEAKRLKLEVATMAEEAVESMCSFHGTNSKQARRAECERFAEEHGEDIASWLSQWALDGDSMQRWAVDANRSADATARLCVDALGVCRAGATIEPWTSEQEPRMRRPAVVPDEGLRTSQSHDPSAFPLPDVSDGRVVPVTSQHLSSVAVGFMTPEGVDPNSKGRDVLMYYYFERKDYDDWEHDMCRTVATYDGDALRGTLQPLTHELAEDGGMVHELFYPAYAELARLLAGQRHLVLAKIDARCNDFAHPMSGFDYPTVALHCAEDRANGRFTRMLGGGSGLMSAVMEGGGLSLYELISFLLSQRLTPQSAESLRAVLRAHDGETPYLRQPHPHAYFEARRTDSSRAK